METSNFKNTATFTHLSTLSQYFIPFGNYIFPIIIWTTNKEKSEFVNHHGKQTLNFQLSLLLYSLVLALVAIPIFFTLIFRNLPISAVIEDEAFIFNNFNNFNFSDNIGLLSIGVLALFLFCLLKIVEFYLVIYASIKASNGEWYKYPMTINFLK
ncbi:DUF4870 domain-containing protein [Flavobacterium sp. TMP13]|uniref:DUF4870 domain-containing protein n=1 Tax=unclassified Flavobacterium TaxID=196869 RepID=UPI00076D2A4B|nr:DUF4870 domain-containing protein [Flavobacterium sp. TAB 87]KVV15424.1 hypothetical protein AP058_01091 [Flavobacterium sp. TAB 87]